MSAETNKPAKATKKNNNFHPWKKASREPLGYIITVLPSGICNVNDKTELPGYVIKLGSNTI